MGIDYLIELQCCPVCGKKAFVGNDGTVNGWVVGCSGYYIGDGIHKKKMVWYGLKNKEVCINAWNWFVREVKKLENKNKE